MNIPVEDDIELEEREHKRVRRNYFGVEDYGWDNANGGEY